MVEQSIVDGHLLVFAHEDEAHAFGDIPHFVTGVGKIRAATELADACARGMVERVTVLGTAGLLDDDLDLETVYRIRAVTQHDFSLPSPVIELADLGTVASTVPATVIATGDTFVASDEDRVRLAASGAGLVDMESYAYAHVCQRYGVELEIFKIPSDSADSSTTQQTWDEIVKHKSEQLHAFAVAQGIIIGF